MEKGVKGSKYGLLLKSFWIQASSYMHACISYASPMHPTLISLICLKRLEKLIFIRQLLFLPRLLVNGSQWMLLQWLVTPLLVLLLLVLLLLVLLLLVLLSLVLLLQWLTIPGQRCKGTTAGGRSTLQT
jgi:hypothetical protein